MLNKLDINANYYLNKKSQIATLYNHIKGNA